MIQMSDESTTNDEGSASGPADPDGSSSRSSDYSAYTSRPALVGGGVAALVFLLTLVGVGRVGDSEAMRLLEATLPTIRFLCSSSIAGASTVLALMLTMLGLTRDIDKDLDPEYYDRIRHIATLCVTVLVGAVGLLLFLAVPIRESDGLETWYNVIYYAVLVMASLLGGALVAIVLAIRQAVFTLVHVSDPHAD